MKDSSVRKSMQQSRSHVQNESSSKTWESYHTPSASIQNSIGSKRLRQASEARKDDEESQIAESFRSKRQRTVITSQEDIEASIVLNEESQALDSVQAIGGSQHSEISKESQLHDKNFMYSRISVVSIKSQSLTAIFDRSVNNKSQSIEQQRLMSVLHERKIHMPIPFQREQAQMINKLASKLAREDKAGRLWRMSSTGRYDRFKLINEMRMVAESPKFDSLSEMQERLVKPLNDETWLKLGSAFLCVVPDANKVSLRCSYTGCPVSYKFVKI